MENLIHIDSHLSTDWLHVGHLGPQELAAAAIAVTWFNLMW
jgi:hypothetical protein